MTKRRQKFVVKHEDKRYPTEMLGISIFILYGECMKNTKLENIIESLQKRGMSEGAISDFLNSIRIAIKKKQLDKLTNDPNYQKILKKYNIEPVPYGKTASVDDLRKALARRDKSMGKK